MTQFDLPKRRLERHRRQIQQVPRAAAAAADGLVERLLFGDSDNDNSSRDDDNDDDDENYNSSSSRDGSSSSSFDYGNINKVNSDSGSNSSNSAVAGGSSTRSSNGSSGANSSSNNGNGNSNEASTAGNEYSSTRASSAYDSQSTSSSGTNNNGDGRSSSSAYDSYFQSSSSSSSIYQPTSSYVDSYTSSTRTRASSTTPLSTAEAVETTTVPASSSSSTSALAALVTAATTGSLTTSVQLVTSTGTNAVAAASTTAKSGSSVSAGPIIGIVAAALAGVVIIGGIAGYLIKKWGKKDKDPFENDPFDRDEFRRHSAMLPDVYESDDGHPSMREFSSYNNLSGLAAAGSVHGQYDDGTNFAPSPAPVVGGIYGANNYSHNENGAPRPPTMLMRHADAHGANVPPMPTALYANGPQMPPMALGGEDPYAAAGVSPSAQNIANPYAHLDRAPSNSGHSYNDAGYYGVDNGAAAAAEGDRMPRSGSDRSFRSAPQHDGGYETNDRPGTSEGRSGTPDIPNVQQTYAVGSENGHHSPAAHQSAGFDFYEQYAGANAYGSALNNPHDGGSGGYHESSDGYSGGSGSPPPALQVRNLTNSGSQPYSLHQHQQQRSYGGNQGADETAYSGVY